MTRRRPLRQGRYQWCSRTEHRRSCLPRTDHILLRGRLQGTDQPSQHGEESDTLLHDFYLMSSTDATQVGESGGVTPEEVVLPTPNAMAVAGEECTINVAKIY